MLEYTGHPLLDIGVATITAFAGRRDPTQLTENDLDKIADYIAREYVQSPLKSSFTIAFTVNAGFFQPAYNKHPKKREIYSERVLRAYRADTPTLDERCVFTGRPAAAVSFDVKGELPLGYVFRQHVPFITGEDVINFHPNGIPGLPVSGVAMLALQAFPLGCAKCGGRLLAVHSDNNKLTYHFAKTFLLANRKAIQMAQLAGDKRLPDKLLKHRTLLIDTLLQADLEQHYAQKDEQFFSLTAYHLSNSGQGPKLDIYYLPLEITGFLREMQTRDYQNEWNAIVHRAWEVPHNKRKKRTDKPFQPRRNWLYEDLFDLPDNAAQFLRTYFLRRALDYARGQTDPRVNYSLQNEASLVSWKITARFLRRIMNMDKERIEQIRKMGDQLAKYVSGQNDRRFFHNFLTTRRYGNLRAILVKANLAHVRNGHSPIITLDPYVQVFEEGDEVAYADWRLARDLVLIRMVEQLYEQGWLGGNIDVIPEAEEEA